MSFFDPDPTCRNVLSNQSNELTTHSLTQLNTISLYYQNVRGLNTKIDMFFRTISECEYDVLGLTETWLNENVSSSELFNDEYVVFRCDRNFRESEISRGGGVLVAARSNFSSSRLDFSYITNLIHSIEIVGLKIDCSHSSIIILVVYIPPNIHLNEFELFFELLTTYEYLYNKNIVILGDFNIPNYHNPEVLDSKCISFNNSVQFLDLT